MLIRWLKHLSSKHDLETGLAKGQPIMVGYSAAAVSGLTVLHRIWGTVTTCCPTRFLIFSLLATHASIDLELTKKPIFRAVLQSNCRAAM